MLQKKSNSLKYIGKKQLACAIILPALIAVILILADNDNIHANPLVNVNADDLLLYDNFLSSSDSSGQTTSIRPFSYYRVVPFLESYERVRLNLKTAEDPGYYIKPLNSFTVRYYYAQEDNSFIEGQSGLSLEKGSNFILFEDGLLSLGRYLVVYCQLKQSFTEKENAYDLHRAYAKLLFYKFSLEGGIDNVNLGPGEYGLLLSHNAAPFPMVKLQTEDQLEFVGKWDFILLVGQLREERNDYSNPRILAARITWKPHMLLELGATRTVMFGGEGRPGYAPEDYWKIFNGAGETEQDSKFDNDGYAGFDLSIYLPLNRLFPSIRTVKLYCQEAATDILTPWQENREDNSLKFQERAFQFGALLATENHTARIEYAATAESFYSHRQYDIEGYTYQGLSLGYPYGRNAQSIFLKHRYYFKEYLSAEYRIGGYRAPCFQSRDLPSKDYFGPLRSPEVDPIMKRYFFMLLIDARVWNFIIEGYFRYDKTDMYDENPLPTQHAIVNESKSFYTAGLSLSWRI